MTHSGLRQTILKQSRNPLGVSFCGMEQYSGVHANNHSIPWAIIHGFFRVALRHLFALLK
jgi:hypothetical protein